MRFLNSFNSRFFIQVLLFSLLIALILLLCFLSNIKISAVKEENHGIVKHPSIDADLVIVPDSYVAPQRAYCLDGSNPGFFFRKGSSSSVKNWILHLPSGGWCRTKIECLNRSGSRLGSSRYEPKQRRLQGIMNANCRDNPGFCNWNVADFLYCDGGSFAGNLGETLQVQNKGLYLRGAAIFDVIVKYLLETTKLSQAQNILLTGSSAGSLAALIQADHLKELLPQTSVTIKAIVDGGMFSDQPSINGERNMKNILTSTFHLHNIKDSSTLNSCFQTRSEQSKWECFMPEHLHKLVKTPVFFFNSFYDTWYFPSVQKIQCTSVVTECSSKAKTVVDNVIESIRNMTSEILAKKDNGVFITSCPCHTVLASQKYFSVKSKGITPAKAVSMWMTKHGKSVNIIELESHLTSNRNC